MASSEDQPASEPTAAGLSRAILQTAHSLSVDLLTADVVAALRERGVPSILLKGPTIANWLYSDGGLRPYGDSDILVPPNCVSTAQETLLQMGFHYGYETPGSESPEDQMWVRGSDTVDLHWTIHGAKADPAAVWTILSERVETAIIGGLNVTVLTLTARAMHVALHAAHHGRRTPTPMTDLARALQLVPFQTWREAAELAAQLEAAPALATGLSLLPAGEDIASQLGLEKDTSVKAWLRANTAPSLALSLEELRTKPGRTAKVQFIARRVFPSPVQMRFVSPLARRGIVGLLLAWSLRLVRLSGGLIPALGIWRRARRENQ